MTMTRQVEISYKEANTFSIGAAISDNLRGLLTVTMLNFTTKLFTRSGLNQAAWGAGIFFLCGLIWVMPLVILFSIIERIIGFIGTKLVLAFTEKTPRQRWLVNGFFGSIWLSPLAVIFVGCITFLFVAIVVSVVFQIPFVFINPMFDMNVDLHQFFVDAYLSDHMGFAHDLYTWFIWNAHAPVISIIQWMLTGFIMMIFLLSSAHPDYTFEDFKALVEQGKDVDLKYENIRFVA